MTAFCKVKTTFLKLYNEDLQAFALNEAQKLELWPTLSREVFVSV